MKTFILMTKMTPKDADIIEVTTRIKGRARHERTWLKEVKEKCPEVKFLAHYTLLGNWDFMDIYEAPDEEAAAIVTQLSQAVGAHLVENWGAVPNNLLLAAANAT